MCCPQRGKNFAVKQFFLVSFSFNLVFFLGSRFKTLAVQDLEGNGKTLLPCVSRQGAVGGALKEKGRALTASVKKYRKADLDKKTSDFVALGG